MFLHPAALAFYDYVLRSNSHLAMYGCRLWDVRTKRMIQSFKAYNTKITGKIGFKTDVKGRIDRVFLREVKRKGIKYYIDDWSMVGIHAHRSLDDQRLIRSVWNSDGNNRNKRIGGSPDLYEGQYTLVGRSIKIGMKFAFGRKSRFVRFVKECC